MSKKKIKKNTQSNLKIFEFSPGNIIDGVNKNVGNFFQTLKKDREKNKLRREKEKKIQEKKEIQQQKKQAQKDKINRAKEEIFLLLQSMEY